MKSAFKTQCDYVLEYLKEKGSISQAEAMYELGVSRLASRIADLKKDWEIDREMETRVNRYGKKVSFARYHLKGLKKDG